jgi:hypothetical protein
VAVPGRGSARPACCDARFDQVGSRQPAIPDMLALQGKILSLLAPDGPADTVSAGMQASPGSYFADLRALSPEPRAAAHPARGRVSATRRYDECVRRLASGRSVPSA